MTTNQPGPMAPISWIPDDAASLLDVGCNVGELLRDCQQYRPQMRLAGIDLNGEAVEIAKLNLPAADIRQGLGSQLPFPDNSFQYVTCIEVIEHVPAVNRPRLLSEIRRVLVPGGRLVLRCPHAGIFSWLDPQNFRFRFPRLHKLLLGTGNRDAHYQEAAEEICWHHHFSKEELAGIAGEGWEIEDCRFGGLFWFPLTDILRWPFNRTNRQQNWFVRWLERSGGLELNTSFGRGSYGILMIFRKL